MVTSADVRGSRLLGTFPTVGSDRAYRLLDHFGSVQACITATADELERVPGIGPETGLQSGIW
ncbi:MAG: hypothetical protein JO025_05520 [Verrucomicrobia bacterium]|nr:hypothetical protein [Verrucomicrobiota bacterium]